MTSKARSFLSLGFLLALSACGPRVQIKERVVEKVLKVPMNSWGVEYRYFNTDEMAPNLAAVSEAVVQIKDFINNEMGSGFLVNDGGIMITAAHVIGRDRCLKDSCKGILVIRDSRVGGANVPARG